MWGPQHLLSLLLLPLTSSLSCQRLCTKWDLVQFPPEDLVPPGIDRHSNLQEMSHSVRRRTTRGDCYTCRTIFPENCTSGELSLAACGCQECAGALGDVCGGIWNLSGFCASNLTCEYTRENQMYHGDIFIMNNGSGVCTATTTTINSGSAPQPTASPPAPCCPQKTVGNITYHLTGREDRHFTQRHGCLNDCIYSTVDSSDMICFKGGNTLPEVPLLLTPTGCTTPTESACNLLCDVRYPEDWTGQLYTTSACPESCPICSSGGVLPPPNSLVKFHCFVVPPP